MKGRNRSRSSSSLGAPRIHPPPLVSAVSDPALNLNNNVLLAHLLTNSTYFFTVYESSKCISSLNITFKITIFKLYKEWHSLKLTVYFIPNKINK